ncbi:MAG: hypothetical protein JXQ91_03070 [Vannielia sp.]|uniref:hypothetical protein n=1 Tax=Rhodobacterales TaxID=204455 RepID=UPI0020948DDC|nr:hypothetical protein [Oceanicola sp. 502str15]MCO6382090.1 hypothetical protein [Oceanicola sp. 502str15]
MRKLCLALGGGLVALALAAPLRAADPMDTAAYDLLFKEGTLDRFETGEALRYRREVSNALLPDAAARDTGEIVLSLDGGAPEKAQLKFVQDGKHRGLGEFPASVGNPVIMYFVETVVRDMAESTGGSPYYIRNRVKEALISPADITEADGVVTVVMHPFEGDPNAERMKGFGTLTMTVVMSEDAPGWYRSLGAEAGDTYGSQMVLEGLAE